MIQRRKWTWAVDLTNLETNRSLTERVTALWSPDHETVMDGVVCAAVAQANVRTGKRHMAISSPELVTA